MAPLVVEEVDEAQPPTEKAPRARRSGVRAAADRRSERRAVCKRLMNHSCGRVAREFTA
jgi:hypothetical protein